MNEQQWNTAHILAQRLVTEITDVNEVGKVISYLRNAVNQQQDDAGTRFFKYLQTLTRNGRQIGHSGRTSDYYRNIDKACRENLTAYEKDASTMLEILGWTSRLMRYYKEGGVIGEITNSDAVSNKTSSNIPAPNKRQQEVANIAQSLNFQVGKIVEATVINIKGKEVSYQLSGDIKLTVKEPKKFGDLSVKQITRVEILELRENGIPKKVKCVD